MKVRSPYAEPVVVPGLDNRTVNPGQVVDVPDGQLPGFLEAGWAPADAESKKAAALNRTAAAGDHPDTSAAAAQQEG